MSSLLEMTELSNGTRVVPVYVRYADRRQAVVLRFTDQHGIRCRRSRTFTGHGAVADARRFLGKLGARERGEHPS